MRAVCISCGATVKVKKLKGKAPCCHYYNTLIKAPSVRKSEKK